MYFNAILFVDSAIILGAFPALYASNHRKAHKHHLSPATNPGNLPGIGVIKLFPLLLVNCKNSSSIIPQTTCVPISVGPVTQLPSR